MNWNFYPWQTSPLGIGGNIDVMPSIATANWPGMTVGDKVIIEYPNNVRDGGEIVWVTTPNDSPIKFKVDDNTYTASQRNESPIISAPGFIIRVYGIGAAT